MRRWPDSALLRGVLGLVVGGLAGATFAALHSPLPWMIGPLVTLAALRVGGAPLGALPGSRQVGQWIVGTALGLYFTPVVARSLAGVWPLLVAAALFAIAVGYASGLLLARLAGIDRTTAIFASVPGGAAEMSTLAERFGGRVDQVAAAQSLRILIVVVVVPYAFAWSNVHGADPYVPGITETRPAGLALLLGATLVGGFAARALRVPNAFVLGALAVAIPLTASHVDLSAVPGGLSAAAQVLLGSALAARFAPEFLRGAHRFVGAVVATIVLAIAASAAFGVGLATLTGQSPPTLVLGTAPGGIAEMCLTAKALSLGVPLVTACHVTRVVALLLLTAPLFERVRAYRRSAR